jgi:hypothetical protein
MKVDSLANASNIMPLDKAIQYGKERRKPYYDSRRFDYTCRNNGKCSYCVSNRTHSNRRNEYRAQKESMDWYRDSFQEDLALDPPPWKWLADEDSWDGRE